VKNLILNGYDNTRGKGFPSSYESESIANRLIG